MFFRFGLIFSSDPRYRHGKANGESIRLAIEEGVNEREAQGVAGKRRSKRRCRLSQRALSAAWISSKDRARQMTRIFTIAGD